MVPTSSDPTPRIHALLALSSLSANVAAMLDLAVYHDLFQMLRLDPLAILGGFLAVGLAGMMTGAICGLSLKLLLQRSDRTAELWWGPMLASGLVSVGVGLLMVHWVAVVLEL